MCVSNNYCAVSLLCYYTSWSPSYLSHRLLKRNTLSLSFILVLDFNPSSQAYYFWFAYLGYYIHHLIWIPCCVCWSISVFGSSYNNRISNNWRLTLLCRQLKPYSWGLLVNLFFFNVFLFNSIENVLYITKEKIHLVTSIYFKLYLLISLHICIYYIYMHLLHCVFQFPRGQWVLRCQGVQTGGGGGQDSIWYGRGMRLWYETARCRRRIPRDSLCQNYCTRGRQWALSGVCISFTTTVGWFYFFSFAMHC